MAYYFTLGGYKRNTLLKTLRYWHSQNSGCCGCWCKCGNPFTVFRRCL
jgi:hypothetical protein